MSRVVLFGVMAAFFFLLDWYVFQSIKYVFQDVSLLTRRILFGLYWLISLAALVGFLYYNLGSKTAMSRNVQAAIFSLIFVNYFSKLFGVVFLLIDDLWRAVQWVWLKISGGSSETVASDAGGEGISRSDFLVKTSLIATAIPALGMSYGIISGAHDYRVRRLTVKLKNLPRAFDGIRLGQISDIHSGSFYNKTAVKGGVEMLLAEKPDLIFFTGDLVNNMANEINDYVSVFEKVSAPLGVYSTLGNHDYGDYVDWPSAQAKRQNLQRVMAAHQVLGWNLLMDEHRILSEGDGQLAIIGIQNWGTGRFPKYGDLSKAYRGAEAADTKLLLSHDPSHWDAQVRPEYPDIDISFAGHTHGMQFGIEVGDFQWSPIQYVYEQWAGLYQAGEQFLYVNRGYGYLVFPGRIGMPPEITIMELVRG